MKLLKSILLISIFKSCLANAVESEPCDVSHRWWVNLGMGKGTTFAQGDTLDNFGFAAQLSFNGMITNNLFVTLESTGTGRTDNDHTSNGDVGLLLGYKKRHSNWYWSGAVGISYYKTEIKEREYGRYYYRYSSETEEGVGIPVEAQLFWTPVKHFGVGIIGHGVVSQNPYAVAMIGIQVS
ncbi:hypothetical protein CC99x_007220 [Candidatus Berkiella cookevillensis]|nr:hypothetical protein [Candidatus Berkiella cookevillensis]MCS5708697.1 hypothetical protein [Candidatus Berkiella cookevillensis]